MASRPIALIVLAAAVLAALSSPLATAAAGGCEGDKFPAGRSYAHCAALPYLGARLHWTYDAKTGLLSVAFVAKPAGAGGAGWVSWAINPTGDGMKGAQALVAFKAGGAGYAVRTYNMTGYAALGGASTPIAYKASDLAADETSGGAEVRLYGKLQLAPGTEEVNHIWQVGAAVNNGAPAKHAFAKDNLLAKGKLALSGAALAPAPAPEAAAGSSPAKGGGAGGAAPSGGNSAPAAAAAVSAPVMALAGLLAILW